MKRRAFLGVLMASIGAAAVPADLLWKPAELPNLPEVLPGSALTLARITEKIGKTLSLRNPHGRFVPYHHRVGDGPMAHQWNVSVDPERYATLGPEGFNDALIMPVTMALDATIRHHGAVQFGELMSFNSNLEGAVWNDERMAVRGCAGVYFDPIDGEWRKLIRFDVLGG